MAAPAVRMSRVELRVADVARSAGWYRRTAGLEPRDAADGAGEPVSPGDRPESAELVSPGDRPESAELVSPGDPRESAELASPGRGEVLVVLRRAEAGGPSPRRAAGLFHTAFLYPRRAQLAAALRRVAEARLQLTGASDHLASEALYLDDPDALGIELYADRPRETWPKTPDGRYVLDTLPLDLDDILAEPLHEGRDSEGVEVGHVHLKVADLAGAVDFWTRAIGMDLTAEIPRAGFLSTGGYHHHIGVNTWFSDGAPLEPADGPGLGAGGAAGAG
ncbi:MAG TPA: VOC family protein, partial [Solirubrobacteraceae bacterium]|nr:VOC family protein [Solirubrobacteraceae bacterium]